MPLHNTRKPQGEAPREDGSIHKTTKEQLQNIVCKPLPIKRYLLKFKWQSESILKQPKDMFPQPPFKEVHTYIKYVCLKRYMD